MKPMTEQDLIEQETQKIVDCCSHPAGFDIGNGGMLCLRPTDEASPPKTWEVDWSEWEDDLSKLNQAFPWHHCKNFDNLKDAARFFVEKRRSMKLGCDYLGKKAKQ